MKKPTHRFTLIELLVVIATMMILAALLMPALAKVRFRAKTIVCLNMQDQWGQSLIIYSGDNNMTFYDEGTNSNGSIHDVPESFEPTFGEYGASNTSSFFCPFRKEGYNDAKWLEGLSSRVDHMGFGYWVERPEMKAKEQGYGSYARVSKNSSQDMLWSDTVWAPTTSFGSYPAGVFNDTWATRHDFGGIVRNMNVVFADGHGEVIDRAHMDPTYLVQGVVKFYGVSKKP